MINEFLINEFLIYITENNYRQCQIVKEDYCAKITGDLRPFTLFSPMSHLYIP